MNKNNLLYFGTLLFVIILFSYLFYLSTNYIINFWTYSQAHINYSDGFVKRGLFGSFALFLEGNLNIKFVNTFNIFFIIIYLSNIFIFFLIIKQYSQFNLIFLFLALSPTLILFSFNDLGGYQRFDAISIFLILLHSYYANLYRSNKISFESYLKKFKFVFIPLISTSILVHEIQIWSLPFHFFLINMIFTQEKIKSFWIYFYFLVPFLVSLFVFLFPVSEDTILSMYNNLENKENLWRRPITAAASVQGNFDIIFVELKRNFFNLYNLKINLFFLILAIFPINFLMYYFNKNNFIQTKGGYNLIFFYLSIIPYLTFLIIGDTGRWIHLIAITSFSFFSQYPIIKKLQTQHKFRFSFLKLFNLILIIFYCFFIRMPHGGNYEEKNIKIWGGINKKFEALYKVYFSNSSEDKYNLNKRFKKSK